MPGKRRRERDRPDVGSGYGYDPNKRVLLCYDSDDGEASSPPGADLSANLDENAIANYEIPAYGEDDDNASGEGVDDGVAAGAGPVDVPKTEEYVPHAAPPAQANDPRRKPQYPGRNKTTNQRPALGSLSFQWDGDNGDEDEYDSETEGAMAYLRAVRSERDRIPGLLLAPRNPQDEPDSEDDGYISEDAYIGRPTAFVGPIAPPSAAVDPREAFDAILKQKFMAQRARMHQNPTGEALAALTASQSTCYRKSDPDLFHKWMRIVRSQNPSEVQVQAIDQDTAFRLLELIEDKVLRGSRPISEQTSCWIWSLLARVDDVGTMDNSQVSVLRELGKKAVLRLLALVNPEAAQQLAEIDNGQKDAAEGAERGEVEGVAEGELDGKAKDAFDGESRLASLDMIIHIIGDVFGQRDLLEFRRVWEPLNVEEVA